MRAQIITIILIFYSISSQASDDKDSELWLGLKSSFSLPVSELLIKPSDNEWNNLFRGVSVRLAYSYPLTKSLSAQGLDNQGESATNSTLQMGLKYTPISYWYLNANFIRYLQPELQKPWDADISYSFGYDDWHPYTLSLSYSNTLGNSLVSKKPSFNEGTWVLGWKLPLSDGLKNILLTGYGDTMGCSSAFSLTPKYSDSVTKTTQSNKMSLSLGCKYTIFGGWYINFNALYYPDSSQKQPWNPDFTYGFGYFDWHPGTISVQYNNYSGNRFNQSKTATGTGEFKNGSISVAWSKSW
ncbi:MAG: hypothetical protein KDI39_00190 [Pseudomonadales bacterium]|nr:hypothetical protein [Pseudomonadales bacterium]